MFKKAFLVMLCLLLLGVTACMPRPAAPEDVLLRVIALRGPTGIGMVSMMEHNPRLGANVAVEYQLAETPDIAVSRVLSREGDIVALPTNIAARLFNGNSGYQLLAVNTWGNLFMVGSGEPITNWEYFRGKTVHSIGVGATPDIIFRFLLRENGLDPDSDLTLDYTLSQVELATALAAGAERIALAVLPEPFVTTSTMRNPQLSVRLNLQEEWMKVKGNIDIPQGCLVVNAEFAAKHPEVAAAFLKEYESSINWLNKEPADAGVLVEKHNFGMPALVATQSIPRSNIGFSSAADAKGAVETFIGVLLEIAPQTIGGRLPDASFYYQSD